MVLGSIYGWRTREKENYLEIDMKASGKTGKDTVTVFSTTQMVLNTKENGKIT